MLCYFRIYCNIGEYFTFFCAPYLCIVLHIIGQRVQESMRRVDPGGILVRTLQLNPRRRRRYSVPAPNSLWHIDGNHKLIRYQTNINQIKHFSNIYFTVDFTTLRNLLPSILSIQRVAKIRPCTILINPSASLQASL